MEISDDEIQLKLEQDPGDPIFADYAEFLRTQGEVDRAMHICLSGISSNPAVLEGRLVLARLYYEEGHLPFAVRELEYLKKEIPENKAVASLLEKLSPESLIAASKATVITTATSETTLAEGEFAFDELDLLDDEES
ncbi:MAG: hypothetical protein R3A13_08695 [Bdellovibrionota bacterium]